MPSLHIFYDYLIPIYKNKVTYCRGMAMPCPLDWINVSPRLFELV